MNSKTTPTATTAATTAKPATNTVKLKLTTAKLTAHNTSRDVLLATGFNFVTAYNEFYQCNVWLTSYANGQNCIRLEDNIYGEPVAHATTAINLNNSDMYHAAACADHAVIKDYCENEGMLAQLQAAGIVGETVVNINGVYSGIHMCKLQVIDTPAATATPAQVQGELPV